MIRAASIGAFIALWTLIPSPARGGVIFIENSRGGTNGELSGDNLNPTNIGSLTLGVNSVTGQVVNVNGDKPDIFTFTIPTEHALSSLVLTEFASGSAAMFVALDNGPTFTFDKVEMNDNINFPDTTQLMGASVVGTTLLGQDILVRLAEAATNNSGSGFTRPLGAGVYSMYIQETGGIPSNYTLTFNITAVPEPSAMLLLGCVATVALPIIWNRKRRGR